MFKCTDCGKKFQQKPDYCDCGNNAFDIVGQVSSPEKIDLPEKSFFEQYPQIKQFFESVDVLSGAIFAACLILAVFSWFWIGSWKFSDKQPSAPENESVQQVSDNSIPDINRLWDNTPPKQEIKVKEEQVAEPVETPETTTPPIMQEQKPSPVIQAPKPKIPPKSNLLNKNITSMSPAMKSYTEGLKQSLFSQWAVGSISGAGLCEVEFSVSPSGKLLGRRFSKQSDNNSLNSATYDALMSLPQYGVPPSDYHGEKIRISFQVNHGYYEVKMPRY